MSKKGLVWTEHEDMALMAAVREHQQVKGKSNAEAHKANWGEIAKKVKSRTPAGCQARWNVALDPTVDRSPWTPVLDEMLMKLYKDKNYNSWTKRAKALACGKVNENGDPMRRGGGDCCDRYFHLKSTSTKVLPEAADEQPLLVTETKDDEVKEEKEAEKERTSSKGCIDQIEPVSKRRRTKS